MQTLKPVDAARELCEPADVSSSAQIIAAKSEAQKSSPSGTKGTRRLSNLMHLRAAPSSLGSSLPWRSPVTGRMEVPMA